MSNVIVKIIGIVVIVVAVTLLLSLPVYLLWNWLMPTLFGLPLLTFWQAMGLNALAACLFKSSSGSSNK